jgi:hypothetical protein
VTHRKILYHRRRKANENGHKTPKKRTQETKGHKNIEKEFSLQCTLIKMENRNRAKKGCREARRASEISQEMCPFHFSSETSSRVSRKKKF